MVFAKWLNSSTIPQFAQDRMKLLSMLHVRSEYRPQQWATFDTLSARAGLMDSESLPYYNANAVIMHGEAYGKIKAFDADAANGWAEAGFPRAYFTFIAQAQLASWLRTIVDALSENMGPSGNSEWTTMVVGGLHCAHEKSLWSTCHHQEFAPPSTFDPDAILKKARNHLDMLVDEIELKQTSPEHMRQYALEVKSATSFNEAGMKSAEHGWDYISLLLVSTWTDDLVWWHRLVVECEHLKETIAKSGISVMPGARLTRDVDTAIRAFGVTIKKMLKGAAADWEFQIYGVSSMRDHLSRPLKREGPIPRGRQIVLTKDLDPKKQIDRVIYYARTLFAAIIEEKPGGVSWLVSKLKRELKGVAYNRSLEYWMSGIALINEFSVLWSWRQTIDHASPENKIAISDNLRSRDMLTADFGRLDEQAKDALDGLDHLECSRLLQQFCKLPPPKGSKDRSWLNKMTDSRKSLTDVWIAIRSLWNEKERILGREEEFRADFLSRISFDTSPEYLAGLEEERQRIEEGESGKMRKNHESQEPGFARQAWDLQTESDGAVRKKLTKKTNSTHRNVSIESRMETLALNQDSHAGRYESNRAIRIAVKQDSLSIISKMFPTGAEGSTSVRWLQLVQALTDAGLVATEGAGSAVSFANEHGSISVHKPHPDPVVDAIRLRGIGRRLRKRFGWESNTFILREKGEKKRQEDEALE